MSKSLRFPFERIIVVCLTVLLAGLFGCATPRQAPELPAVSIGVAEFIQPQGTMDMLAGFMPENTPRIPEKTLAQLDETFAEALRAETKRTFAAPHSYLECRDAKAPGQMTGRVAALKRWVAVGNCMNVEFLLVPQVYELYEREGSEAGVTRPAGVIMDIFLIDVTNSLVTGRSHFDETQSALTDNLLDTPKFISRRARWISATELAREGMVKAIRDLGL